MSYYCNPCDKTINLKTKPKHLKSKKHKYLEEFIIMRYNVANPDIGQLNGLMKKYVNIFDKEDYLYQMKYLVVC